MDSEQTSAREAMLRSTVLAGDAGAWKILYEEAFDRLHAFVHWRSGGLVDVVEDVVQDTWLIAVKRLRQFDPAQGNFGNWLRGIAGNLLRNRFRLSQRKHVNLQSKLPQASANGTAGNLEKREQAERIGVALSQLPEQYEAVLRAKYLDDQSVAEIAKARSESPKAIESLLTRARQAFRNAYPQDE